MKTLVLLAGFIAVSYGVFVAFLESLWQAALWVLAGLALQLAGGAASESGQRGPLENPVWVVARHLRDVRARVQSWDERA